MDAAEPRKRRWFPFQAWTVLVVIVLFTVCCWFGVRIQQGRQAGRRSSAFGRLGAVRLALLYYENEHKSLPPLCLRDKQGNPTVSWRGIILPFFPCYRIRQPNLSQPWNSEHNRKIVDETPLSVWACFARDRASQEMPVTTHIFAYLGPESIWDAKTGLPKAKATDSPNAIMLISVPKSEISPLQPRDITEEEVRKLVAEGQEVLFQMCNAADGGYGVVRIKDGKLAFCTWQEAP
jgi:hypothetical protein